jgi:hypothetical protein
MPYQANNRKRRGYGRFPHLLGQHTKGWQTNALIPFVSDNVLFFSQGSPYTISSPCVKDRAESHASSGGHSLDYLDVFQAVKLSCHRPHFEGLWPRPQSIECWRIKWCNIGDECLLSDSNLLFFLLKNVVCFYFLI